MKTNLLFLFLLLPALIHAQTTTIDDFENWNVTTQYDLDSPWITSNQYTIPAFNIESVKKVTGYSSPNAARIEAYASTTGNEAGYIINTDGDPLAGEGGVPYSQQPTAIKGYWRYNIPGTDTGLLFVVFKKNGVVISSDIFRIKGTGSQTTFALFSFPLSLPATPDSVIIGASCSNVLAGTGVNTASWLELDSLHFTGPSVTQAIPNGNFETWISNSSGTPDNWISLGEVKRTTDKYSGTYAAELITDGMGFPPPAILIRNIAHTSLASDTISAYYKYSTTGSDSGVIIITAMNGTTPVGTMLTFPIPPSATFTQLKIPVTVPAAHDSLGISIMSSGIMGNFTDGSTLIIDKLELTKQAPVSVNNVKAEKTWFSVYPNPAGNSITISSGKTLNKATVYIVDAVGKVIINNTINTAGNQADVSLAVTPAGMYKLVLLDANGQVMHTQSVTKQ